MLANCVGARYWSKVVEQTTLAVERKKARLTDVYIIDLFDLDTETSTFNSFSHKEESVGDWEVKNEKEKTV